MDRKKTAPYNRSLSAVGVFHVTELAELWVSASLTPPIPDHASRLTLRLAM